MARRHKGTHVSELPRGSFNQMGKVQCMQISVSIGRWDDESLLRLDWTLRDGSPATAEQVREYLDDMRDAGYTVLPCKSHECDAMGKCTGEPLS